MGYGNSYAERNATLRDMGFASYSEYLASSLWSKIRAIVFRKHDRKCHLCKKPATEVHHINYPRSALEGHKFTQMRPLCHNCHKSIEFDGCGNKLSFKETRRRYFQKLRKRKRIYAALKRLEK